MKADLRANRQSVTNPIVLNKRALLRRRVDHDIRPEPSRVEIAGGIQRGKSAQARSGQEVYGIAIEKAVFHNSLARHLIAMREIVDVRPIFLDVRSRGAAAGDSDFAAQQLAQDPRSFGSIGSQASAIWEGDQGGGRISSDSTGSAKRALQ